MHTVIFAAVDHPAIACRDTRRQIDWYRRNLGMRVVAQNDADPPTALMGYDQDLGHGAVIELMPPGTKGPIPPRRHGSRRGSGTWRCAYTTSTTRSTT